MKSTLHIIEKGIIEIAHQPKIEPENEKHTSNTKPIFAHYWWKQYVFESPKGK